MIVYIFMGILIISILALICSCTAKREGFKAVTNDINAACLFAVHDFDEDDYRVVKDHANDIHFYIINNGPLTDHIKRLIEENMPNVIVHQRENEGWDLGAWKEGIQKYQKELSKYSHVILANNSCIYANNWRELLARSVGYDMYGHLKYDPEEDKHGYYLMSWHIIVSNKLFNDKLFKKWFDNLKPTSRDYCIDNHETKFAKHFNDLGFSVGINAYNGKLGNVDGMLKKKEKTPPRSAGLRRWMNDYIPPYIYF